MKLWLENVDLQIAAPPPNIQEFYDIEFSLSVRGTGIFLHQRKQNPCENALRFERKAFPLRKVHLHTGFLDTKLRPGGAKFSRFLLAFRIAQHRVQDGFLFDQEYPERTIYSESMEVRVDLASGDRVAGPTIQYRWLSETTNLEDEQGWQLANATKGSFRFQFRQANTLTGELCIQAGPWPDATTESMGIDAAQA